MRYPAGFNEQLELAPRLATDVAAAAVLIQSSDPNNKEFSYVSSEHI